MGNTGALIFNDNNKTTQHFIDALESKDQYTQGHSHHVNVIVEAVFDSLPLCLREKLNREQLLMAALLHDVGKILTPDSILNKAGALDGHEWEIMRQHPANSKKLVEGTPFSYMSDWVLYHHERIDGRGYYSLKREEIPLESKIIAIADTFSALRTYRIYRPAYGIERTVSIMRESAGTQLDAELLDCFLSIDMGVLEKLECNCEVCRVRRDALEALER